MDCPFTEYMKTAGVGSTLGAAGRGIVGGVEKATNAVANSRAFGALDRGARHVELGVRRAIPKSIREPLGTALDVVNHPATMIGLVGAGLLKGPES